ncbi:hypothetical protein [Luteolibacter sp. AS25]|uniref:hypothetical protein n=1 Tax=Luteolibacter sp. AS25 TaxID=3135776 RepID=UPI00398AB404
MKSGILLLATASVTLAAPVDDSIAQIREQYAIINEADLEWETLKPPFEDIVEGDFKRGSGGGKLRKSVLSLVTSDHGGSSTEIYYNPAGDPIFLFENSSYWTFTQKENETKDNVTEHRIYFKDGKIIQALEKNYEFLNEDEKASAAEKAQNKPIATNAQTSQRFLPTLLDLKTAAAPKIVVLSDELSRAMDRLEEGVIPLDNDAWGVMKLPRKIAMTPATQDSKSAAFAMLLEMQVIQEGEDVEQPNSYDFDVLERTDRSAVVAVTLSGMQDDEIESVRYRVEMRLEDEMWILKDLRQQMKKWPDRAIDGQVEWFKP